MYDTILVTLDGTPTDRAIIEHIKQLAKVAHSRLVLLHVADGWAARTYGPDAVSPEIAETPITWKKFGPSSNRWAFLRRPNWRTVNRQMRLLNGSSRRVATWWP